MFAFYVAEFDTFGSPLVQRETSLNSRLRTCQKTRELDKKKLGLCMYAAHLYNDVIQRTRDAAARLIVEQTHS